MGNREIDDLLSQLDAIRRQLDKVARDWASTDPTPGASAARLVGEALGKIGQMQGLLYNEAPQKVPQRLLPSVEPVRIPAIARRLDGDSFEQATAMQELLSLAPQWLIERLATEDEKGRAAMVREWATLEHEESLPLHRLCRFLRDGPRWQRYHAAHAVRELMGVELWDAAQDDVDQDALQDWCVSVENDCLLSPADEDWIASLSPDDVEQVDSTILGCCSPRWTKVAMVIGRVFERRSQLVEGLLLEFVRRRIERLAEVGALEKQGDLRRIRFSEVRLPPGPERDEIDDESTKAGDVAA